MAWGNPVQSLTRRFYLRIWLAVAGSVVVFSLVIGWAWHIAEQERDRQLLRRNVTVLDVHDRVIAAGPAHLRRLPDGARDLFIALDGAPITIRTAPPREPQEENWWSALQPPYGFMWTMALSGLVVMLGVFPIARRLTRQLEELRQGVQRWGGGDLSARFPESGRDEVADLARYFNTAAEHIQTLIQAQKSLLANASHELRSPLTRISMALALASAQDEDPARATMRAEIRRDIAELDQLVGEILLASRLDARPYDMGEQEAVDMTGVLAEECARVGATLDVAPGDVTGTPFRAAESGDTACVAGLIAHGVPRLLRRAARNLLENAYRYGQQADSKSDAVRAWIGRAADNGDILLHVDDHGPGVPPDLRERIFEPFYRLPGASEREGGVGLGLALVRTIAQRHGGSVVCSDHEGGGARFTLRLPCERVAPQAMAA